MVPAGALLRLVLRDVLLDAQDIIGSRDEREQSDNDRGDTNRLKQLTSGTGIARDSTRGAQGAN